MTEVESRLAVRGHRDRIGQLVTQKGDDLDDMKQLDGGISQGHQFRLARRHRNAVLTTGHSHDGRGDGGGGGGGGAGAMAGAMADDGR